MCVVQRGAVPSQIALDPTNSAVLEHLLSIDPIVSDTQVAQQLHDAGRFQEAVDMLAKNIEVGGRCSVGSCGCSVGSCGAVAVPEAAAAYASYYVVKLRELIIFCGKWGFPNIMLFHFYGTILPACTITD